jgi:hypothetical protein
MSHKPTFLENFPVLNQIYKVFGLYPIVFRKNNNQTKISRTALFITTIHLIVGTACYYQILEYGVSKYPTTKSTSNIIGAFTDKISVLIRSIQMFTIFLPILIHRNRYNKIDEKLEGVDGNFQQINHKVNYLKAKNLVIHYLVLVLQAFWAFATTASAISFYAKITSDLTTSMANMHTVMFVFGNLYGILTCLHFWFLLYAMKKRFDKVATVLYSLQSKSIMLR